MARITCPNCSHTWEQESSQDRAETAYRASKQGLSVKQTAELMNISPASVHLYRRLGIAMTEIGVRPGSKLWSDLMGGARANRRPVCDVIDRRGTIDDVQAAVKSLKSGD